MLGDCYCPYEGGVTWQGMFHPQYWFSGCQQAAPRHMGGANMAFVDGHSEWLLWEDLYGKREIVFDLGPGN